jgi:hypothetical protein
MSVYRFQLRSVSAEALKSYTKAGGSVTGATLFLVDVDLNDDADAENLQDYMASIGYDFVEAKPLIPIP